MAPSDQSYRLALGIFALAAVWIAMHLLGAGAADREIMLALYAREEPGLALAALAFTFLGDWSTLLVISILGTVWLLFQGNRWGALTLILANLLGRALVTLQKIWFARLRPEEDLRLVDVHSLSFPSGHAANSMIAYLTLALLLFHDPRHRRIAAGSAIALSLLIGLSRPMLGVHWPSDVIAGWSFGLVWVTLVLAVMERWRPRTSAPLLDEPVEREAVPRS